MPRMFDSDLRALRRDRACRQGAELFLYQRVFEDILDRLTLIDRQFKDTLLVGCPSPSWPHKLPGFVTTFDPGGEFAKDAGGKHAPENAMEIEPASFDLAVTIGTLDTAEPLPDIFARLRFALRPGGLLIGGMAGGDSIPMLRGAMAAADAMRGEARPHVHPRVAPASLTQLLSDSGFVMPVVDVDRVNVRYPDLMRLVGDLRAMAATNVLTDRPRRSLGKIQLAAAEEHFKAQAESDGKIEERFDVLHFMGWAPQSAQNGS